MSRGTVSWDEWKLQRRATVAHSARLAQRMADVRDRRMRTEEERRALYRAALDAIRARESAGRLVWLDERRVRLGR
ncbi:MAG: hypothetical protein Kow0056_11700 [Coriobacteriia bacterium]